MTNSTLRALPQPEDKTTDLLTDLLRAGARDLIAQAVVRNGFLPERTIQTGIGAMASI